MNDTKAELDAVEQQKQVAVDGVNGIIPQIEEWRQKKTELTTEIETLKTKIQELTDAHDNFQGRLEAIDGVSDLVLKKILMQTLIWLSIF